jgi:hypothetical protein
MHKPVPLWNPDCGVCSGQAKSGPCKSPIAAALFVGQRGEADDAARLRDRAPWPVDEGFVKYGN